MSNDDYDYEDAAVCGSCGETIQDCEDLKNHEHGQR